MKFQLFGRLKDDGDGEDSGNQNSDQGGFPGMGNSEPATQNMRTGDSLERMVDNMFNQGYSEEEITEELSGEYSPQDINDAINRAVANSATGGQSNGGPEPMSTYDGQGSAMSPMDEGFDNGTRENNDMGSFNEEMGGGQQQQPEPQPQQPQGGQQQQQQNMNVDPNTEELVETIVAENMDQILQEFDQAYSEIDELKEKMEDMEQRVHDLEVRDDEDQQQFVSKVEEMEDHVDNYQSRIGGLEKAFQQILPSLVDNVRDLTELVQEIKTERGIETEKSVSEKDIKDINVEDW